MDEIYEIPENPTYNPQIRKLKNSDPAHAETIFNPLFSQIINNIHSVKIIIDALADKGISLEALINGLAAVAKSGNYNDLTNKPDSLPANGGTAATISEILPVSKGGTNASNVMDALKNLNLLSSSFNNKASDPTSGVLFYSDFAEFGYSSSMTMAEFFGKMPSNSAFIFRNRQSESIHVTDVPTRFSIIFCIQGTSNYTFSSEISMINNVLTGITFFISFVAAISLLVGGIGIMNIMLVTVTERTREIGIRKSLGATDADIKRQFLIEAVILSVIGGFIGVVLGYSESIVISMVISKYTEMDFAARLSWASVAATVMITGMIGIIFGVYPAGKAAKLDPIEALRYE